MKHIQWFPGHMTKAMRMMEENLRLVDGVLFVLDARAPAATFNKNLRKLFGAKPVLCLLNKSDLANERETDAFVSLLTRECGAAMKCTASAQGAAKAVGARIGALLLDLLLVPVPLLCQRRLPPLTELRPHLCRLLRLQS